MVSSSISKKFFHPKNPTDSLLGKPCPGLVQGLSRACQVRGEDHWENAGWATPAQRSPRLDGFGVSGTLGGGESQLDLPNVFTDTYFFF